jgi:hypothetical protein
MPVCPNCGVAYVDGESHDCRGETITWRNAVKVVLITTGVTFIALILVLGLCSAMLTM